MHLQRGDLMRVCHLIAVKSSMSCISVTFNGRGFISFDVFIAFITLLLIHFKIDMKFD